MNQPIADDRNAAEKSKGERYHRALRRSSLLIRDLLQVLERTQRFAGAGTFDMVIDPPATERWSPEALRIFGLEPREVAPTIASYYDTLVHPDDRARVQRAVNEGTLNGEPFEVDHRVVLGEGRMRRVLAFVEPAPHNGGETAKLSWTVLDTGDRERELSSDHLAEEILHAQKMEAVGRLAGAVTHDFSNLLMGIAGCADIALSRLDGGHPAHEYVAEIKAAAIRGSVLPKRLLAFAHKRTEAHGVIDLNAAVSRMEQMVRVVLGTGIDLRVSLKATDARVRCDRGQVEQMLMSLTSNARDAMPLGGAFTLETDEATLESNDRTAILGLRPGAYVVLLVSDDGCGMDDHTKAHAFEPFFTTKGIGSGTGLGLSTAYAMVRQAGGHIQLHSETGKGTSFRIFLPRSEEPLSPEQPEALPEIPKGLTILVVEDQRVVRLPVRSYLERSGFRVLEASNAREARRVIATQGPLIDVMLTDIVLPDMAGTELGAEVKRDQPKINIVYMSASYLDENLLHGTTLRRGFNFLEKPFGERDLMNVLRHALA